MLHFRSSDIGMFGRRQRHARGHRIPVSIIIDSTEVMQDRDTAFVVDDFGGDETLLPGTVCRCCTVRPKLQNALRGLLAERKQGRHFTRVVIETNENPGPILRTFVTERALGAAFYVEEAPALAAADGVDNFALTEDAALSWDAFSRFITTFTALRGADLLHVKGLLNIEGCHGPVVVQFMQHLSDRPIELQAWPDDDRTSRIAFTTRDIEEKTVRAFFDSVRALS